MEKEYEEYTDEELAKSWNYLETKPLSHYVAQKMDRIEAELKTRRVIAWNHKGEITQREIC